jgi:hypothetical protein
MDTIEIEIMEAGGRKLKLTAFPALASEHRLVKKGLAVLRQYLPDLMNYIAEQRTMGRMPACRIAIKAPAGIDAVQARHLLGNWLRRKKNRRLLYVALEVVLMPFSAFVAILPGPNVVFYLLFVLFYFHLKAFISLRKVDIDKLNIVLVSA